MNNLKKIKTQIFELIPMINYSTKKTEKKNNSQIEYVFTN